MLRLKIVLKLFAILLLLYLVLRMVFGAIYFSEDGSFDFVHGLKIVYWGMRMDLSSLFYINLPFLVLFFLVMPFLKKNWQVSLSAIIFSLTNLPFLALNIIDVIYFGFNHRRSTVDIFYSLPASFHSFGSLARQYWLPCLVFMIVGVLFVFFVYRILLGLEENERNKFVKQSIIGIVFIALFAFVARGWNTRPITPSTPLLYFQPEYQPLINNSTFNFVYSYKKFKTRLQRKNYFTEEELDSVFPIRRQYNHDSLFNKKNVVIFLLESFSESYFHNGSKRAVTPFFDSIRSISLVCTAAFQNGHESVKGALATIGSLPSFLDEPLYSSNYSATPFKGLGAILKEEGYTTNFFLGAEYDHFNFTKFSRMVGIEHYYAKENFNQPDKDDGAWGIYDEYFFPYFADVSSGMKQPFFSVLYNISSHPPFKIPDHNKERFNRPGKTQQLNSVEYVDYCFSQLFEKIKKQLWFDNTIFVFVADHALLTRSRHSPFYEPMHIPLFIHDPSNPVYREIPKPVQQLDVVPSVLDMLCYSKPFMSFGNSFLRNGYGYSISMLYGAYQLIDSSTVTGFDEHLNKIVYQYDKIKDSALKKNLVGDTIFAKQAIQIRAILQRFNNSFLDQKLLIEK